MRLNVKFRVNPFLSILPDTIFLDRSALKWGDYFSPFLVIRTSRNSTEMFISMLSCSIGIRTHDRSQFQDPNLDDEIRDDFLRVIQWLT